MGLLKLSYFLVVVATSIDDLGDKRERKGCSYSDVSVCQAVSWTCWFCQLVTNLDIAEGILFGKMPL